MKPKESGRNISRRNFLKRAGCCGMAFAAAVTVVKADATTDEYCLNHLQESKFCSVVQNSASCCTNPGSIKLAGGTKEQCHAAARAAGYKQINSNTYEMP
jgi:hypothetical protein